MNAEWRMGNAGNIQKEIAPFRGSDFFLLGALLLILSLAEGSFYAGGEEVVEDSARDNDGDNGGIIS